MIADVDLYRLAGWSSWLALVALVLSGVALGLFFAGAGAFWGPVNDALTVVTAIALIPAVLAVARIAGDRSAPLVSIVTVATVAGLVLIAVGQTLLIVGRLSLEGSYVTGGIGVIPVLGWIVLIAVLSLGNGVLPSTVGWLAVATLAGIVMLAVVSAFLSGPILWVAGAGLLVVLIAWLSALATTIADRGTAVTA
jgi:hypothetical protein